MLKNDNFPRLEAYSKLKVKISTPQKIGKLSFFKVFLKDHKEFIKCYYGFPKYFLDSLRVPIEFKGTRLSDPNHFWCLLRLTVTFKVRYFIWNFSFSGSERASTCPPGWYSSTTASTMTPSTMSGLMGLRQLSIPLLILGMQGKKNGNKKNGIFQRRG